MESSSKYNPFIGWCSCCHRLPELLSRSSQRSYGTGINLLEWDTVNVSDEFVVED